MWALSNNYVVVSVTVNAVYQDSSVGEKFKSESSFEEEVVEMSITTHPGRVM